jgi:hypothetical protein
LLIHKHNTRSNRLPAAKRLLIAGIAVIAASGLLLAHMAVIAALRQRILP